MGRITVLRDFTSTDENTKGQQFTIGQNIDTEIFSPEYESVLVDNEYIRKSSVSHSPQILPNDNMITVKNIDNLIHEMEDANVTSIDVSNDEIHINRDIDTHGDIEERVVGPVIITIIAIFGALFSGYMTVMGYSSLFPNAGVVIMSIIIVLEMSKFSIASVVLHQKGLDLAHKLLLGFFAFVLVIMASIGHYGFLSKAYGSSNSVISQSANTLDNINLQLASLQSDKDLLKSQLHGIPDDYVSAKRRMFRTVSPKIDEIDKKLTKLNSEKDEIIKNTSSTKYQDHNAMSESAKLIGITSDQFANYVILLFAMVIDPLIILMASAASSMRRSSKKNNNTVN